MYSLTLRSVLGSLLLLLSLSCMSCQFREGATEEDLVEYVRRHPYIANIRLADQSVCTGVLIGNYTVLTSAECIDPRRRLIVSPTVWLNATRIEELTEGVLVRQTVEIVLHPNYTGNAVDGYNLAMLRIDESAAPLRSIRILDAGQSFPVEPERQLSVLGFGRTSVAGARTLALQIGQVQVVEPELCIESMIGYIEHNMFCVDAALPCAGDQGGPVFVDNGDPNTDVLFGLASGTACFERIDLSGVTHLLTGEATTWVRQTRDMLDARGTIDTGMDMAGSIETGVPVPEVEAPSPESELEEDMDLFLDY